MAEGRKDLAGQAGPDDFGVQFCFLQSVLSPSLMLFISVHSTVEVNLPTNGRGGLGMSVGLYRME